MKGKKRRPAQVLVSLRGTAEALGAALRPVAEPGSFEMEIAGSLIRFSAEYPAIVWSGERVVSLSRDARRIGSDLYLPTDFLARVVMPILKSRGPGGVTMPAAFTQPPSAPPAQKTLLAKETITRPAGAGSGGEFTVFLDPGHGGTETGAEGKTGILEKEITLDVAKRLKAVLETERGLDVLLTRDTDSLVELDERTALANQNHADLFVSIHVNSAPRHDAKGAETYFLSYRSKDEEVRTLAAIENNAAGVDHEKLGEVPEGLELVLWDMAQAQYLKESSDLAETIQKELNDALGVRDRGVKQAPFRVLMGATMPAVLVEVGFISNPAEEASLKTEEYRDRIAVALSRAIVGFLNQAKRRQGVPASRVN